MIPITSPTMLGKVLRQYRKEIGLTQSAAARKFNQTQKSISNMESGLPGVRLSTVFKYMSTLGLEMHLESRTKSSGKEIIW